MFQCTVRFHFVTVLHEDNKYIIMPQYLLCFLKKTVYTFMEQPFEPVEIRMFPLTAVDCGVAAVRDLEGHFHILFSTTSLTSVCHNAKLIRAGFFWFF